MRKSSYTNLSRYRGHACANILLRCMDGRFHTALEEIVAQWFMERSGSRGFASIGLPGGVKALLDPARQGFALEAIGVAVSCLGATRIALANHADCRAYGGSETHPDPEREKQFHVAQLHQAREVVLAHYPQLEVMLLYQDWEAVEEIED